MSVLCFDGLLTQVRDAGVYFLPNDDIDELVESAAVNRFACLRIDLRDCDDKHGLLIRLADALHFPAHFAHNWDALADEAAGKDAEKKLAAQDPSPRQLI